MAQQAVVRSELQHRTAKAALERMIFYRDRESVRSDRALEKLFIERLRESWIHDTTENPVLSEQVGGLQSILDHCAVGDQHDMALSRRGLPEQLSFADLQRLWRP